MSLVVRSDYPCLRERAVKSQLANAELYPLVADMYAKAQEIRGWGLAAPQIGIPLQIAVVTYELQRFALVNPTWQLLGNQREQLEDVEGCFSLPDRQFFVRRFPAITVTSRAGNDEAFTIMARGKLARVIQHELDHLRGVLIDAHGTEIHV